MGRYINWPDGRPGQKQEYAEQLGATQCTAEDAFIHVNSDDKAVLVWVDNGPFEALAYAYSRRELEVFLDSPRDGRPKKIYVIDKAVAEANAH